MMPKFATTLQFRISAMLLLFGAALVISSHILQLRRELEVRRKSLELLAYSEGTRLSGVVQHLVARQYYHALDLEISYAAATSELVRGMICDEHDVVRHSTKRHWIGLPLRETPLRIAEPLITLARETMQGQIREVDRGRRYIAVFPYLTGKSFNQAGVVIMEYDLARATAEARDHALNATISRSFLLLAACLLLWLLLQSTVTQRVRAIISQSVAVGARAPLPEPLHGKDEFALISRSFLEAARRLRDTESRMQQLTENMRDLFWAAPLRDHAAIEVNEAYQGIWHLSPARLARHRWDWLRRISQEDRPQALRLLREFRDGRESADVELRLSSNGNAIRWLQVRAFLVRDHLDQPVALAGFAFDVTERKNVERRLLLAAEEERWRIGSDLHDDVCQRLAAAKLKCGMLRASLTTGGLPQAGLAGELASDLALANNLVRGFAKGLMPVALGVDDLGPAFTELARFVKSSFGVPCEVENHMETGGLDQETSNHVYRIAQELAINAAKHARATQILIRLTQEAKLVRLEVINDGQTFLAMTAQGNGMGLQMVQRRVEAIGAALTFEARAGGGTRALCEVPVASYPQESHDGA